jgi:aryl-alcohol dehydrogenase
MQISAAVAREPCKPLSIESVELAEPQDHEVLVKMVAVGICHSDIAARDQALPFALPAVLGHEGAGIVEKVGSAVTRLKPGDKVVLTVPYCGHCVNCEREEISYCENGMELMYAGVRPDGSATICRESENLSAHFFGQSSFATYALSSELNAVKMKADTDLTMAAPLGCGIQTGAGAVLRSLNAQPGRALAVFGAGTVGMSAVMGGKIARCHPIIVVEPVKERRELALELGATHVIDPTSGDDTVEAIRAIVPRGVDYAVDTSAVVKVLEDVLAAVARHGQVVMLGVPHNPEAVLPLSILGFLANGVTLKGVIEGDTLPDEFIPELYAWYEEGKLPLDKLITTYDFEAINTAIEDQLAGKAIKPVLSFD